MALVTYSDSEGSDDEEQAQAEHESIAKATILPTTSNSTIDKTQPNKIKVNLQQKGNASLESSHDGEPATKRQRVGAGVFSGFNSMLPAPKRDNASGLQNGGNKPPARKVFSLKTGAEAAFSRDSDAELRNLFAEQNTENEGGSRTDTTIPALIPKPTFAKPPAPIVGGNPFAFKPLSVARNQKKKKSTNSTLNGRVHAPIQTLSENTSLSAQPEAATVAPAKKKISLFSTETDTIPILPEPEEEIATEDDYPDDTHDPGYDVSDSILETQHQFNQISEPTSQSLDTIASDLNLSHAERRQLFGRNNNRSTTQATSIINFNTDAEYAANQQLIAAGETIQHNPVRGIAPGKHSLRQLVNTASAQKEALEESFAQGKRNKREAGNKYGW